VIVISGLSSPRALVLRLIDRRVAICCRFCFRHRNLLWNYQTRLMWYQFSTFSRLMDNSSIYLISFIPTLFDSSASELKRFLFTSSAAAVPSFASAATPLAFPGSKPHKVHVMVGGGGLGTSNAPRNTIVQRSGTGDRKWRISLQSFSLEWS